MSNKALPIITVAHVFAAVVAFAPAVSAAQTPTGGGVAAAPAVADPLIKICRTMRETGSHLPGKRLCHTRAEWEVIDSQNRASAIDNAQDSRFRAIQK